MAVPDPSTAVAYLAQVPQALQATARAHTDRAQWQGAAGGALAIIVFWLILKSGLLVRLRREAEHEAPRPWLASLLCAFAFLGLSALLMLPWTAFIAWRGEPAGAAHGFDLPTFIMASLRQAAPWIIEGMIGLALICAAMRQAPRTWWIWCATAGAVMTITVVWLPFALASGPTSLPAVPAGPTRDGLLRLVRETRLPVTEVYVAPISGLDANVTGVPRQARVWISQGLLDKASPAEVRANVAHLIGHFRNFDDLTMAILLAALIGGGCYAMRALYGPAVVLLGARDLDGPADPASLPVLAAIAVVWLAPAGIAFNTFDRLVNVRADQFSLDHAREPDGLAAVLLRDWRGDKVDPSPLEEAIFYDHPSLKSRVLHAMAWKAAHPAPKAAS